MEKMLIAYHEIFQARTVVGSGEEGPLCDPGSEFLNTTPGGKCFQSATKEGESSPGLHKIRPRR